MGIDGLAQKIIQRDKNAFNVLYEKMRAPVYATCLSVLRNHAVAEEITRDTFVTVWVETRNFKGRGYKTWILTIARNKSLTALKKYSREQAVDFTQNERLGGVTLVSEQVENSVVLKAALKLLDETQVDIVLLKNSGVKTKEIALTLGLPRGTVSWKYSEALKILKKYLEDAQ